MFGISPETGKQMENAQLYFAGGWPVRAAAILLLIGALWFGFFYLRDGKRPSLWGKAPLLLLRLTALSALLIMLLQPMLRIAHSERQRSSVVVLADTSLSMSLRDTRLPADRAAQAQNALGSSVGDARQMTRTEIMERIVNSSRGNLLSELSKRYNLRLYRFDSDTQPLALPKSDSGQPMLLKATPDAARSNSTQIGAALKRALDDTAGQRVSGLLVLSDGGNNLGDDPVGVAERARQQGMPVSTLGIGDPTPTRDLAITETLAEAVVRKDNGVQVFAGLAHRGYEGQHVTVTLRRGGEVLGTKPVTLGPSARKQTVAFAYTPKQVGSFDYSVSVNLLPNETDAKNNRKVFSQRVVGKKLKILYVEGEPRWEYRYLKNAILRDNQIEFSCYLTKATAEAKEGGEGNVPVYRFPPDEKSLFAYDILILGDVPRSYFSDLQLRNIRRFVEDKGSSLIVIAGEKHTPQEYRGTTLDVIFPVVLPAFAEQVKTDEPYQWELTPEGRQDPLLRLADDPTESAKIWKELPGMLWNAGVERAKPGATVLAVNSARSNAYGKRVVLAVQSFGAGRCLMQLVDTTWRWRWRVGDRYFYRYWGQALRAMTPAEVPGGNRFAQVNADRADYLLGERISLHARLLDSFYRPVKDPRVVATLRGETGAASQVTLNAIPGSPGLYSADFLADRIGKFNLTLASPAAPDKLAKAEFRVQSLALEQQQPEMNEALLKRIALSGGGRYYHPDELKKWVDSLKANDLIVKSESEVELWDAPLILALFVVPLAIEWIVRKRLGMA